MAIGNDLSGLEHALGYRFADPSLLEAALTHDSYANELRARGGTLPSNERLEFLGDAVLQLVITEELYRRFPHEPERALSDRRRGLVCRQTLATVARSIALGEYLHLGKGEESTDCRERPKVLADAMEATIAALYLDALAAGYSDWRGRVLALFEQELSHSRAVAQTDPKSALQRLIEQDGSATLTYVTVAEEGPPHERYYTVQARVNSNVVGTGRATTKKDAEMQAAQEALALFDLCRDGDSATH